jgi:hypothetical protein
MGFSLGGWVASDYGNVTTPHNFFINFRGRVRIHQPQTYKHINKMD